MQMRPRNTFHQNKTFQSNLNNKLKYIRINRKKKRGNRDVFELQTAVATLSKDIGNGEMSIIDLHSQLHFGDEEYFSFYNADSFDQVYEKVF
jgi:hypothetical protein